MKPTATIMSPLRGCNLVSATGVAVGFLLLAVADRAYRLGTEPQIPAIDDDELHECERVLNIEEGAAVGVSMHDRRCGGLHAPADRRQAEPGAHIEEGLPFEHGVA